MRVPRTISALLAAVLMAACGGSDSQRAIPVAFKSMQEAFSGSYPRGTYVFRTQAELQAAWQLAPQQFGEPMPIPVVDFAQHSIVGISLGVGLRCDIPIITRVDALADAITVYYRTNEGTGVTTLACLHQWRLSDFVRIPAIRGAVTFERLQLP